MQRAIQKRGELWAPTGKVLKLKVIEVLHDHSATEKPGDVIAEVRRQRSPVFQARPSRAKNVRRYLDKHAIPCDCSQMDIPTLCKMQSLMRKLNNSAPGPDGIPHTAWKRIPSSAQLLLEVALEVVKGYPVPLDFNDSLMIFTPKESEPDDGLKATSLAKATRPFFLKNTDCKMTAAMGNELVAPIVAKGAHGAQKGSLPKRRFIERA
eukprot:7304531-Pyramimonas_sp.AAC.1